MRGVIAFAAIVVFFAGLSGKSAEAKGGPNPIDFVMLSGGELLEPRRVEISLPDDYDHMSELYLDEAQSRASLARARYSLLIHMSWPEEKGESGAVVQPAQVWEVDAVYDGDSQLYLAEPQHGERAGWFVANPLFAQQLKAALREPAPPSTGTGQAFSPDVSVWYAGGGVLVLVSAILAAVCWARLGYLAPKMSSKMPAHSSDAVLSRRRTVGQRK